MNKIFNSGMPAKSNAVLRHFHLANQLPQTARKNELFIGFLARVNPWDNPD
jgi:hypothetical protein